MALRIFCLQCLEHKSCSRLVSARWWIILFTWMRFLSNENPLHALHLALVRYWRRGDALFCHNGVIEGGKLRIIPPELIYAWRAIIFQNVCLPSYAT